MMRERSWSGSAWRGRAKQCQAGRGSAERGKPIRGIHECRRDPEGSIVFRAVLWGAGLAATLMVLRDLAVLLEAAGIPIIAMTGAWK